MEELEMPEMSEISEMSDDEAYEALKQERLTEDERVWLKDAEVIDAQLCKLSQEEYESEKDAWTVAKAQAWGIEWDDDNFIELHKEVTRRMMKTFAKLCPPNHPLMKAIESMAEEAYGEKLDY